jgi:hypothetical protein
LSLEIQLNLYNNFKKRGFFFEEERVFEGELSWVKQLFTLGPMGTQGYMTPIPSMNWG